MPSKILIWSIFLCSAELIAADLASSRPNIVMIFSDDQGWHDVGCYGSEIPTPHIDSIAREGVKLTKFYAASSICTPSRYGLLTGKYPSRSKDQLLGALMFLAKEDRGRGIRAGEETYVSKLQESGYRTSLVGKWHLGHGKEEFWPTKHGFESFFGHTGGCVDFFTLQYGTTPDWYRGREIVPTDGYATDVITDEAVQFLKRHGRADAPFYLHVAYNAPHFGKVGSQDTGAVENKMQPKPEDLARVDPSISEPSRRAFAAKVIGMDDGIGRILQQLDQLGLRENTFVIFMTDHGGDPVFGGNNAPLRGGKAELYEGGLRVPCVMRWPGKIVAGTECDAVTWAIDMYPTLCRVAGIHFVEHTLDGVDLLPLLAKKEPPQRELFWHTGKHAELERAEWTALRMGRWKLVDPPDTDPMLFDLDEDPYELVNLADADPKRLQEMLRRVIAIKAFAYP